MGQRGRTSLDKLETELYAIAKDDPDNLSPRLKAIETTLKNRRYGTADYMRPPDQQTNFILNVTMEEHFKRLTRMGVPLPRSNPTTRTWMRQRASEKLKPLSPRCHRRVPRH